MAGNGAARCLCRSAGPMNEHSVLHGFASFDGVELAWTEVGDGRPLVLLHGYFSDARTNWIKYGHAVALANAGFRVIMPDLRGHGDSAKPHDPDAYPPDVLADDALTLVAQLNLTDYDLGGYSLGGRTVARMLVRGAKPRRAIISGMGLAGLTNTGARKAHFRHILTHLGEHKQGSPEWLAEAFLKTTDGDAVALNLLLDSFVDTSEAELAAVDTPVLALSGADDRDNGSAADLAALLPRGTLGIVPGNHMSAVAKPDLGAAMVAFLTA